MAQLWVENIGVGLVLHVKSETEEESNILTDFSFPDDKLTIQRTQNSDYPYAEIEIRKEVTP